MNWKKHVRTGLNLFMGTMAGVFLGSSLYTCLLYTSDAADD